MFYFSQQRKKNSSTDVCNHSLLNKLMPQYLLFVLFLVSKTSLLTSLFTSNQVLSTGHLAKLRVLNQSKQRNYMNCSFPICPHFNGIRGQLGWGTHTGRQQYGAPPPPHHHSNHFLVFSFFFETTISPPPPTVQRLLLFFLNAFQAQFCYIYLYISAPKTQILTKI